MLVGAQAVPDAHFVGVAGIIGIKPMAPLLDSPSISPTLSTCRHTLRRANPVGEALPLMEASTMAAHGVSERWVRALPYALAAQMAAEDPQSPTFGDIA
ncbi:hypothetical protein ASD99_29560 [Mesorhizobium sp. Root695]|uniref:hypothetical protein n=1 Tax=Mesorhizobium sp. Root695 TaxID=1736589 RepID=UPI00070C0906|nr:hypothetical protein [Mesorhizobium sp. Root695]KRB23834.1 hypothetical protein ASD99_29560 [Mesorhizobium sp. Root695]